MYASSPCIFEGFQVISCKERRPFSCLHRFLSTRKSGLGAIQNPEINRNLDWRPWCASQEHHFLEAPENRAVAKFLYVFHLCAFSTTATDFSFESKSLLPPRFVCSFSEKWGSFLRAESKFLKFWGAMFHHLASLKDFYLVMSLKEKCQAFLFWSYSWKTLKLGLPQEGVWRDCILTACTFCVAKVYPKFIHFLNLILCCRASEFPRDYDGACLQMRLSYSPAAHLFLFLVQWTDCSLAGALGLLRILIYKVIIFKWFFFEMDL